MGGLSSGQHPALSVEAVDSGASLIQNIVHNENVSLEGRAFYLLSFAESLFYSGDWKTIKVQYSDAKAEPWTFQAPRRAEDQLFLWATSYNGARLNKRVPYPEIPEKKLSPEIADRRELANGAINEALTLLESSKKPVEQITIMYVASRILKKHHEDSLVAKCRSDLKKVVEAFESRDNLTEAEILAVARLLTFESDDVLSVDLPMYPLQEGLLNDGFEKGKNYSFTDDEFNTAESLRKKANRLLDRLPAENTNRRMGHRNLAVWYDILKKTEQAEVEKSVLYDLTGIHNERILYPAARGCGHFEWWVVPKSEYPEIGCGMG